MDTAADIGVSAKGRRFALPSVATGNSSGYEGRRQYGFEVRQPVYPFANAFIAAPAGGGDHEDDGACWA